jgi:hypothetical protein
MWRPDGVCVWWRRALAIMADADVTRSPHFNLEAAPNELAGAVHVEALLVDVVRALTATPPWWAFWRTAWPADTLQTVHGALATYPCGAKVKSGTEIEALGQGDGCHDGARGGMRSPGALSGAAANPGPQTRLAGACGGTSWSTSASGF